MTNQMNIKTAHIESEAEQIAKNVIMPGDPLRAKYIAENFLEDAVCINTVRNCLGYTGTYKGKQVTVFASGMGMPSIGIYSYELYKYYNVENIIRVGTAGSYNKDIRVLDIVLAKRSYSDSSYALVQNGYRENYIDASSILNEKILDTAKKGGNSIHQIDIYSSDVFYNDIPSDLVNKYQLDVVEMESFALFHNAKILNKQAACILSVSNSFVKPDELDSIQRQNSLNTMISLALESSINL